MSKANLEGRQAQIGRSDEYVMGGFAEDGREVVKKEFKSGRAAEKPEFFIGGSGPVVPTGPKRKLRTNWMTNEPKKEEEPPPPIAKPTKRWTPVGKRSLPPRSKSHDGTLRINNTTMARRGGKKPAAAKKEEEEDESVAVVEEVAEEPTITNPSSPRKTAPARPRMSVTSNKPKPIMPTSPTTTTKKAALPLSPTRSAAAKSPPSSPEKKTSTAAASKPSSSPISKKADPPTKPAPTREDPEPSKKKWQPSSAIHIRKPIQPAEEDKKQQQEAAASETTASTTASCPEKDALIQRLQAENAQLKLEKGELAKQIKKSKSSASVNKELKEEIFELKQELKKKDKQDANSKGYHKLENKLNTLKMVMDGRVDKTSLEALQDHVDMLHMILHQDLKKEGMRNVWY